MAGELQRADCMLEEEERFHGLHPLKRFKILEKERVMQKKEEDVNLHRENEVGVKVCSLPAKKRVCALQFFTGLPDEDDEQENRNLLTKTKKEVSSVAARALQPINSNRQLPVSVNPDEKERKEKKTREATSVVTRANLLPASNRRVLVPTDSTDRGSKQHFAKGANRQMPVTIGEGPTGEQPQNAVKLVKKRREVSSDTLHHTTHQQLSVASGIAEREIEAKIARNKKEASLASANRPMSIGTGRVNSPYNWRVSVATAVHCESVSVITRLKSLEEQSKETDTCCAVNVQPIHDHQVSIVTGQTEKAVATEAGEEESDDEDDGVFCDVCKGADAEPSDPIVFCDGCNVMVHPSCYGSPLNDGIPAGDWFCRQCESENRRKKTGESQKGSHVGFHVGQRTCASRVCCLCPSRKGAMKRTTGGAWAHLSCALYVPEVFYKRARDREGIECGNVPAWRSELPCVVCATRGQGSCIQCTEVACSSTFHVSCALNAGLTIDFRNANALTKTPAIVIAFCHSHSRQALTSSERRRFKIVPRG